MIWMLLCSAGLCARKPRWCVWVWSTTLPRIQLWPSISSWRRLCKRANGCSFATASYCPRYGKLWHRFLFKAPTCCAKSCLHREKFGLIVCCFPGTHSQVPVQICDSCPLQTAQEVKYITLVNYINLFFFFLVASVCKDENLNNTPQRVVYEGLVSIYAWGFCSNW